MILERKHRIFVFYVQQMPPDRSDGILLLFIQQQPYPPLHFFFNQPQPLIRQIIPRMPLEPVVQQFPQCILVALGHHGFSRTDEVIINSRHKRIRIGSQTVSILQIAADCKIEKRIAVVEQRCRSRNLIRMVVNQQTEVAVMPVRVADCIRRRVRATCTDFESHLAAV